MSGFILAYVYLPRLHRIGLTWNYQSWSISVEFWVNICLFFVLMGLIKHPEKKAKILAALTLTVIVIYIILEHSLGSIAGTRAHTDQIAIVINTGLLRGFGGIFLGVLVYELVKVIDADRERWTSTFWGWGIKSLIEIGLLRIIFYIVALDGVNSDSNYVAILIFSILLTVLSVGKHSLLRELLSLKPFIFLGLISYSIYLGHMPLLQFFGVGRISLERIGA